ncbi:hypothetical protein [Mycobacteroides immunogenum]|uniref:Uncharacterized protein n=1 Tax=Mycobacteroides immunogenum TaxID=83262 RepID=A0A7V8RV38_9MYCO|nr:hypothetical protein [Mycobacteroides immunogenum]AMT69928.1 hypothetical protein ABG82_05815 [Mycobacteroides immunogenum]ANO02982.1 hypothetical protein BAB75_05850 [Mycobacteroides immunogenum]KIU37925.1 hypothetical protein TL11_24965 [Mycobacteroides immunogenum]KPG05455.1 hypothetical protein AN909_20800 [Mycobacteroides immunogenum]KPG06321.1 hypothetical protein AN908_21175 [Mycobacteroides immunogenum]
MRFEDVYFSKEDRYSIGLETDSGRYYISIPVSNGLVDYEEYYAIDTEQYKLFLGNKSAAIPFVEACRRHEHDDLLIQKPGTNRGTPV